MKNYGAKRATAAGPLEGGNRVINKYSFNLRNYNESWYGNFVLLIDSYNLITSLNKTIMANITQANYERLFQ